MYIPWLVLVLACAPLVGCGKDEPTPQDAVRAVVSRSVEHQSAMLTILEQHQRDPERAVSLLEAYVREHEAEIQRLAQQRPLLESQSTAFAEAWNQHGHALFERRRRLTVASEELMARPEVTRALGCLDAQ